MGLARRTGPVLPLNGVTVLVVEDHESSRDAFRGMLEACGAVVLEARDGRAALEVLRGACPDVILCDLRMPGMDGLDLAKKLRASLPWRRLPLIAVTGYGADRDYVDTWEAGFDGHLVKPIDRDRLVEAVYRFAGQKTRARRRSKRRRS